MISKVVQYNTLHNKTLVTQIEKRNELCKKNKKLLLKLNEAERSLLFQLKSTLKSKQ